MKKINGLHRLLTVVKRKKMKLSLQPLFLLVALMASAGCSTVGSTAKCLSSLKSET